MRFNKLKVGTAVLVCTAALVGSGLVYAAPQAGDTVRSWYKEGLKESASLILQRAEQNGRAQLKATDRQIGQTQQSGVLAVERQGSGQLKLVNSQVEGRTNSYISQLEEAKDELIGADGETGTIAKQFAEYTTDSIQRAHDNMELEAGKLLDSMTQEMEVHGEASN